jgi:hypothetical protein
MTKNAMFQSLLRMYKEEHGNKPGSAPAVVDWAVRKGWVELPKPTDPRNRLADEFARAWREEMRHEASTGHPYRANHAVSTPLRGGGQQTLWDDIDAAPRVFMQRAFTQRREQVVGDLVQLSFDCEHFNLTHPREQPIVVPLDFTDDVEERNHVPHEAA